MIKTIIFIGLVILASVWLAPFMQTILQAKWTMIYFMTSNGLPIGWLGFTAIFTAVGFMIVHGFLKFFLK